MKKQSEKLKVKGEKYRICATDFEGITLVALVITIIVLIILAGVSINAVMNGGLIKNAKDAKNEYQEAKAEESTEIGRLEQEIKDFKTSKDFETQKTQGYGNEGVPEYTPYTLKNGYVVGVILGEKVSDFEQKLPVGYEVESNLETEDDQTTIGTGMLLMKNGKEVATIIVYGDLDGDGVLTNTDLNTVSRIASGDTAKEYEMVASEVSGDGYVSQEDARVIVDVINGRLTLEQTYIPIIPTILTKTRQEVIYGYIENLPGDTIQAEWQTDANGEYYLLTIEDDVNVGTFIKNLKSNAVGIYSADYTVELSETDTITDGAHLWMKLYGPRSVEQEYCIKFSVQADS